jgi:hypothetical protein
VVEDACEGMKEAIKVAAVITATLSLRRRRNIKEVLGEQGAFPC